MSSQAGRRQNQGKSGAARRCQEGCRESGRKDSRAWYLTMGKYDAVIISEFPNDEASAKFMLASLTKPVLENRDINRMCG